MTGKEIRSPLQAARELARKIRAAADEIEAERELPRPLFEALADAGFYHLAVPRSLGAASSTCRPTSRCWRSWARPTRARHGRSIRARSTRPTPPACRRPL